MQTPAQLLSPQTGGVSVFPARGSQAVPSITRCPQGLLKDLNRTSLQVNQSRPHHRASVRRTHQPVPCLESQAQRSVAWAHFTARHQTGLFGLKWSRLPLKGLSSSGQLAQQSVLIKNLIKDRIPAAYLSY